MNSLATLEWAELPLIDDVEPLNGSDDACLEELRAVLAKHGKLSRFALALSHRHFELGDDERLLETVDLQTRTLTTRPVKGSALSKTPVVETMWSFERGTTKAAKSCPKDPVTGCHPRETREATRLCRRDH